MATKKSAKKTPAKTTAIKKTSSARTSTETFTAEERAAMKERASELRASGKGKDKAAADAKSVQQKIAQLPAKDRALAKKVHVLVTAAAPELAPKLWYGMPAYAKDGKIVCFFQDAAKFKTRYATLGFNDVAAIDDGSMWPTAYAVTALTEADERKISRLVKKAVR